MKLKGKVITEPKSVPCDIFRGNETHRFLCKAVLSYEEFDKLVPVPKAPLITHRNGKTERDTKDVNFLAKLNKYAQLKTAYLIIASLSATADLEWETVKIEEPDTWLAYEKELQKFLTEAEFDKLSSAVMEANSPTAKKQEEAFDRFTPSQAEVEVSPSQTEEQGTTASGELAKDSE